MIAVQKQPFTAAAGIRPVVRQPAPGRARAYPTPFTDWLPTATAAKQAGFP